MRMIGALDNQAAAQRFSDYLYVQGIDNQIEEEPDGSWAIWVHAEDQLGLAKERLASFRANPADPTFQKEARAASELREKAEQDRLAYQRKIHDRGTIFRRWSAYGVGPLTIVLMLISGVVFFALAVWLRADSDRQSFHN